MRYKLIRNKQIFNLDESDIEVCDNVEEINKFSLEAIQDLLIELKDTNFRNSSVYIDIYAILYNLTLQNKIPDKELESEYSNKYKSQGSFSKYLLKIK